MGVGESASVECHQSCAACKDGQAGPDYCTSCKNPHAPLHKQPGHHYGSCNECDPVELTISRSSYAVPIPFRLQLQGPCDGASNHCAYESGARPKCLARGEELGPKQYTVGLEECYADLTEPADVWKMDESGILQLRYDGGDELSKCSIRKGCLASSLAGEVELFDTCAKAHKQGWNIQWQMKDGYLQTAAGKCLDIGDEARAVVADCVSTAHNTTIETGPRYTDGINGEDGGKERWLQCVTDCEDEDRYPPYGRCGVGGATKGWGTCQADGVKRPTLTQVEAEANQKISDVTRKMHQHKSRANLLFKRCHQSKVVPANRRMDSQRAAEHCQDAAAGATHDMSGACLDAGCKWDAQLEYCYFNKTQIPCALFPDAGSCSSVGHCIDKTDVGGRFECQEVIDNLDTMLAVTEVKSLRADEKVAAEEFKKVSASLDTVSAENSMLKGEVDARAAAALAVPGEDFSTDFEGSLEAPDDTAALSFDLTGAAAELAPAAAAAIGRQLLQDSGDPDGEPDGEPAGKPAGKPTVYFKKVEDVVMPDHDACALSCVATLPVCGQDGSCLVAHRECVKLCAHVESRTIRQAREWGEDPRFAQVEAQCELKKMVVCHTTGLDPETCEWLQRSRCTGVKVMWQDRPGTLGQWERNSKGEANYQSVVDPSGASGGSLCPPIGSFTKYCEGYAALG